MKLKTFSNIIGQTRNWPSILCAKVFGHRGELTLIEWKNGLVLICRSKPGDWFVVDELFFENTYGPVLELIRRLPQSAILYDMGANIGLFSLLAATANPKINIIAFEPGLPNLQLLRTNIELNAGLRDRIKIRDQAVGADQKEVFWNFENNNPGMSFVGSEKRAESVRVSQVDFKSILREHPLVDFLKIDIEGSEYEAFASVSDEEILKIHAIAIEVHPVHGSVEKGEELIKRLEAMGFLMQKIDEMFYLFQRAF